MNKLIVLFISCFLSFISNAQEFDFSSLRNMSKINRDMKRVDMINTFGYPEGTNANTNFKDIEDFRYDIKRNDSIIYSFTISFKKSATITSIRIGSLSSKKVEFSKSNIEKLANDIGDNNPFFLLYGKNYKEAVKLLGKPTEKDTYKYSNEGVMRWFKGLESVGIYYFLNDNEDTSIKGNIFSIYIWYNNKPIYKRE